MLGHRAFHSFFFSVHSVNQLSSPFLSVRVIVFLFSRAWGIFENFFSRAGQAHSLAGFGLRVALSGQPMCVTAALAFSKFHLIPFSSFQLPL
jgi:hypothetical protein